MIISYAQNAEDVVLWRALGPGPGRYVDIGAAHPTHHSVTRLFHDHGWRGVNVEPEPVFAGMLATERPEDVNLNVGIAAERGVRTFYLGGDDHRGESSFSAEAAEPHGGGARLAATLTLRELMDEYSPEGADLLKIDVEGLEGEVVGSGDWERHRPRVVVAEATRPGSHEQTHAEWEPILLEHRYILCLFDGLNRFYVREEDVDLAEALSVPASSLDDFARFEHLESIKSLEAAIARRDGALIELEHAVAESRALATRLGSLLDDTRIALAACEHDRVDARRLLAALGHPDRQ